MQMQRIWMALVAGSLMVGSAQAFIVVEHTGDNDPTTQGFGTNGDAGLGSAIDDGGTAAWRVFDDGPTELSYEYFLDAEESSAARNQGFTIRARVRVPITPMPIQANPFLNLRFDGDKRYFVRWGVENSGAINVQVYGGDGGYGVATPTVELGNVTSNDYALYELTYDGSTNMADLFVNGQETISDVFPQIDGGTNAFRFGSGASHSHPDGEGRFTLVNLDIVGIPEPASLSMLVAGGLMMLRRRRSA